MDELVTVVSLSYRKFEEIFKTIQSVLIQNYSRIEYIISDDGSENFPEEEIRQFVHANKKNNLENFLIIKNKKNIGTVRNINHAYEMARGDILMPLSVGDEFFSRDVVSRVVKDFDENSEREVLMVRRAVLDENGYVISVVPSDHEVKQIKKWDTARKQYNAYVTNRAYGYLSGCTLYMRKSFFLEWGGFDEKYRLLEDAPFFAQYMWRKKIYLDESIVGIRYGAGGVSYGKKKHPLLLADDDLFNQTDRVSHIEELDAVTRSALLLNLERNKAKVEGDNKYKRVRDYIRHPLGGIAFVKYHLSQKGV